ncbi:hypothetical protein CDAR_491051 [Caerostris darwini]|uniref:Uncharacterized protein n=1 Tax=Caerostris darwini TaxID=1538125 RepID=A0AAV4XAD4_9ARAC|nr:hypothetical protein CDAR_491051 [Caerostris darwini]
MPGHLTLSKNGLNDVLEQGYSHKSVFLKSVLCISLQVLEVGRFEASLEKKSNSRAIEYLSSYSKKTSLEINHAVYPKMDSSLLRLVCICSLLVSFVACQEEDHSHHRPYRPDINPDMELMPMTRFRPYTTARTITQEIREPISLPDLPHGTDESSYEYYDYYDNGADMSSSGYIHHHALHTTTQSSDLETTTTSQPDAEEYDYDDEHDSNALNQHMAASAPGRHASYWTTLMITLLWLLPL